MNELNVSVVGILGEIEICTTIIGEIEICTTTVGWDPEISGDTLQYQPVYIIRG